MEKTPAAEGSELCGVLLLWGAGHQTCAGCSLAVLAIGAGSGVADALHNLPGTARAVGAFAALFQRIPAARIG